MQITLNEAEIMNALEIYVRSQINIARNQRISIDLKAGRGDNGYSATLEILPAADVSDAPTPRMTTQVEASAPAVKTSPFGKTAPKAAEAPEKETQEEADETSSNAEEIQADEADEVAEAEEPVAKPKSVFSKLSA